MSGYPGRITLIHLGSFTVQLQVFRKWGKNKEPLFSGCGSGRDAPEATGGGGGGGGSGDTVKSTWGAKKTGGSILASSSRVAIPLCGGWPSLGARLRLQWCLRERTTAARTTPVTRSIRMLRQSGSHRRPLLQGRSCPLRRPASAPAASSGLAARCRRGIRCQNCHVQVNVSLLPTRRGWRFCCLQARGCRPASCWYAPTARPSYWVCTPPRQPWAERAA